MRSIREGRSNKREKKEEKDERKKGNKSVTFPVLMEMLNGASETHKMRKKKES